MSSPWSSSEWRSIETAPKDGTKVDLWFLERGYGPVFGWQFDEEQERWVKKNEGSTESLHSMAPDYWRPLTPSEAKE